MILFTRILGVKKAKKDQNAPMVSIVVVFKNELENLRRLIPELMVQHYPNFEVVLCDDFSSDGSFELANSHDDPKIKAMKASKDLLGKKFALREAINATKGDKILVTDADCIPASSDWVGSMIRHTSDKKIVLGYSPHEKAAGFLNKFIRYETYFTALQYLNYAVAKIPYMGVGRNMMYDKSLFLEEAPATDKLISGDDDLFVNAVADKSNTAINLCPESYVYTAPSTSWSDFFKQKRRHVSTSVAYKFRHQFLLGLYSLSHLLSYILFFVGCFAGEFLFFLICFVVVITIKWIIARGTMKKLACEDLIIYFPLLDFMLACYYLLMVPLTFFKPKNW